MIIKGLLNMIIALINMIPLSIPKLPENIDTIMADFVGYINGGIAFLKSILPWNYLIVLLLIVIGIDAAMLIYKFVMWVIRKIPMLGIKD